MNAYHYFASANTSKGFINFFDNINTTNNYYRYIIKGSSGCGKSTLMKKIANDFSDQTDIEYFYCSSDPNSLDGVRLVKYDISILDGTSPHATETSIPSVVDEIVNLGEFINNDVYFYKDKIKDILKEKSDNYKKVYTLLSAIGNLNSLIKNKYYNYINPLIQNQILQNCSYSPNIGDKRNLFLSALGENTIVDLSQINPFKKIVLPLNKYQFYTIAYNLQNKIIQKGNDITLFYDIFSPSDITAFLINKKVLYTYDNTYEKTSDELEIDSNANSLLNIAFNTLKNTRKLHFELEKIYSSFIDFNKINATYEKIRNDIQKRIDKFK